MIRNEFVLDYPACVAQLERRLKESAPGRMQLLAGARQVGKTTLMLERLHFALWAAPAGALRA